MSYPLTTCGLSKALLALLPEAEIASRKQTPWHSATFSGERVTIVLKLTGDAPAERATAFAKALPDTEFNLRRQLVADIVVSDMQPLEDGVLLTVEALLLDE
ncbi:hypothetical protein [Sphingorhabdus sp.]|uniref:hypothetical protein n=1 Tax=Sphingorhabdus sp. TaxID=1902408 RepID=UPI0032B7C172